MAPALDGFTAGHLVDVLLEHGQQFFHSIHNQLVQSADNQIVDQTDEAVWTEEKVKLYLFFITSSSSFQHAMSRAILNPAAPVTLS